MLPEILFVLATMGDLPPIPPGPLEPKIYRVQCTDDVCIVPVEVLAASEELKARMYAEIEKLREEQARLRESKGCGKLDVQPKLKRERNT